MQEVAEIAKKPRTRRTKKELTAVSREEQDLQTHVEICALRYEGIQNQMTKIDERFDKIEAELKELATSTSRNLSEIKTMLSGAKDEKFKTMVTVAGTIIVALLGTMGYLITHLK